MSRADLRVRVAELEGEVRVMRAERDRAERYEREAGYHVMRMEQRIQTLEREQARRVKE